MDIRNISKAITWWINYAESMDRVARIGGIRVEEECERAVLSQTNQYVPRGFYLFYN